MTLNDNPRVTAERRVRLNRNRVHVLCSLCRKWVPEWEGGEVARLYWTGVTNDRIDKARRITALLHKQIRIDEKFLKAFR